LFLTTHSVIDRTYGERVHATASVGVGEGNRRLARQLLLRLLTSHAFQNDGGGMIRHKRTGEFTVHVKPRGNGHFNVNVDG
jgi:hypothetical protein